MKILLLLPLFCGCATAYVERPYVKETSTEKNGTVTVRESSAQYIKGGNLDELKRYVPNR